MAVDLTLLRHVAWRGRAIPGRRTADLLAALVLHHGDGGLSDGALISLLWPDDEPGGPTKALQVAVSRARAATAAHAVVRRPSGGYALGVDTGTVDALVLATCVRHAAAALAAGDAPAALAAAEEAIALAPPGDPDDLAGPLGSLRGEAARRVDTAWLLLARARSRSGDHAGALEILEDHARGPDGDDIDEALVEDWLRSEAAVRGAAAALAHFDRYRRQVVERTGTDPGPGLQRLHADLLTRDRPVRSGLRFDDGELIGRDGDVARLRALVASSRVTSIVGPGGLGKTRLAQLLARTTDRPVVHVVELVGVSDPDDLVGEVGTALGVRDSVTARVRSHTQRADLRSRIAATVDAAPTLLVLDNCEHLVAAVADLVAFLVAAARDLKVVTTSRAPLSIAAEKVYALRQLDPAAAAALFRVRAKAVRPSAVLDDSTVASVVSRLDGLPLAIELAAAKVRVMAVAEISRRLDDRFALLRGGVRAAPDRHKTLQAVIDWSWHLLGSGEQRALRRLSVFAGGFTLEAAEEVLGDDSAIAAVSGLAEQSLLVVRETETGVRYRMLETVREFGRLHLDEAGERAAALDAQRRWALRLAEDLSARLYHPDQIETIDALHEEETNLADVLRRALAEPAPEDVVVLLAALGTYWTITGNHPRIIVMLDALEETLDGWDPPAALHDTTRTALGVVLVNGGIAYGFDLSGSLGLLRRLGSDSASPVLRAMTKVLLARDSLTDASMDEIIALTQDPDPGVAGFALQWLAHVEENLGDPEAALEHATAALVLADPAYGPWTAATLETLIVLLNTQLGDYEAAARHAPRALAVLDRLHALDDAMQVRSTLVSRALSVGDDDTAERLLGEIEASRAAGVDHGLGAIYSLGRAELALSRGRVHEGLSLYRAAIVQLSRPLPPVRGAVDPAARGVEPWLLLADAAALVAHTRWAAGDEGRDLFEETARKLAIVIDGGEPFLDYPVAGVALLAVGHWGLLRGDLEPRVAVELLAMAHHFSYNRFLPSLAWERFADEAERLAPGVLGPTLQRLGSRRGPDLRASVAALLHDVVVPAAMAAH